MPRPIRLDALGDDSFLAHFPCGGSAKFTQTRERPYSGVDDNFRWGEIHAELYRDALRHLPPRSSVLDFGCGSGYGAEILTDAGMSVVGVDSSDEAIAFARLRAPLALIAGDMCGGDYDAIVAIESVEHVEDDVALFDEFYRRLAPGGLLYVTTPRACATRGVGRFHVREYSQEQLAERLRYAGFVDVEFHSVKRFDDTLVAVSRKP